MRRMVVNTARGEFVVAKDVAEEQLVGSLMEVYRLMPDASVSLDGVLVPEEARRAALIALSEESAPKTGAAAPLDLKQLGEYGGTLAHVFDDLRRGYVQSMVELQDVFRRYREMCLDNEQRFLKEVAEQRALTRRSLADIDLLDRTVTTTQLMNAFAESPPQALGPRGGMKVSDLVVGLTRTIAAVTKK